MIHASGFRVQLARPAKTGWVKIQERPSSTQHRRSGFPEERSRIHARAALALTGLAAFLLGVFCPCALYADDGQGGRLNDHLSKVADIVDSSPENMRFRFRTKFTKTNVPQQEPRVLIARRITTPPLLDGILDDPCWKAEGPQSAWKHRTQSAWLKIETTTASYKQTVLYVCYDDKNLYFAFVAEEPEPKNVIFGEQRKNDKHGYKPIYYTGDCAEMFIETGGFGGDGHIWQFIFNIYDHMTYDAPSPASGNSAAWQSGAKLKGAMGPNRWIIEMAVPFKGFAWGDYRYRGPPIRGELWGLRVVRDGRPPATQYSQGSGTYEKRFFSTWTYNPISSWHNPWPTGSLIFDDVNLLRNGAFNEDLDADGNLDAWRTRKSSEPLDAELVFDTAQGFGAINCKLAKDEDLFQVSQVMDVLPGKFYSLSGRIKLLQGQGEVTAGFQSPARSITITDSGTWQELKAEVFTAADQRKLKFYLLVKGKVRQVLIDELTIKQDPFGTEDGVYCLTGNSFRPELNVRDKWKINGRYTYRDPGTTKFLPPSKRTFPGNISAGNPDLGIAGANQRWIPFDKGSLTKGGHNFVQWPWDRQRVLITPTYPEGHEEIFDLGRDFYLTGIDSLFASAVKYLALYVKPEKADGFLLVNKLNGAGVLHPKSDTLYVRMRGINSVARYVKIHWMERTPEGGSQYFMQLWGGEKGDHGDLEVNRFRWKNGITMKKPTVPSFSRIREPFIVPQPRQVTWTDTAYEISAATRIACQQQGLAMGIGRDFAEDTAEIHNIRIPVVDLEQEQTRNPELTDCIVIGDVGSSARIAALAKQAGLAMTPSDPGQQGYALVVDGARVLILGSGEDQQGAFYGVTSVMQLLRRDAASRLIIPGCRIRDWPNALRRGTHFQFYDMLRLADEYKRILRLYSLVRVNMISYSRPRIQLRTGDAGQLADYRDLRAFMRRHYITQNLQGNSWGGAPRNEFADKDMVHIEMMDDENKELLKERTNCGRLNVCPSSSHGFYLNRDLVFAGNDLFNENDTVMLNTDEMGHVGSGSRWNACRRCLRRNLDGPRLFYEYYVRFYDAARRNGMKVQTIDTMLTKDGQNFKFNNMGEAYPFIPRDMVMGSWKGSVGKSYSNPEYGIDHFDRLISYNAWGYQENYGDPYGGPSPNYKQTTRRRMWGALQTYWGSGSNQGMVIGLLAKIQGGQVMNGYFSLPIGAEYLWSPANPMPNNFAFANRMVNFTVRLNERYFARPFPSWQEDRRQKWFKLDLAKIVNWSHIDEIPADGKGWLDWGSNYDLQLMPMGDVKLEEVPFRILDPAANDGKSIIFLANYPEGAELMPSLPQRVPLIPVNRKVASLCFLKLRVGRGAPASFVAIYEDGRELTFNLDVRDKEVANVYGWDQRHNFEHMDQSGKSITDPNPLTHLIDFVSRPGWLGYTVSGDEYSARIHEWVNPYPEQTIRSLAIFYPSVQESNERTAVLAISGIEAEQQDFERWQRKKRPPLRAARDAGLLSAVAGLKPVMTGGEAEFKASASGTMNPTGRFLNEKGELLYWVEGGIHSYHMLEKNSQPCLFSGVSQGHHKGSATAFLAKPARVHAVSICGRFMTGLPRNKRGAGTFKLARAGYSVHVHALNGEWQKIGEITAASGEDGLHYFAVPGLLLDKIRVDVDASGFTEDYYGALYAPGVSYLQAYTK